MVKNTHLPSSQCLWYSNPRPLSQGSIPLTTRPRVLPSMNRTFVTGPNAVTKNLSTTKTYIDECVTNFRLKCGKYKSAFDKGTGHLFALIVSRHNWGSSCKHECEAAAASTTFVLADLEDVTDRKLLLCTANSRADLLITRFKVGPLNTFEIGQPGHFFAIFKDTIQFLQQKWKMSVQYPMLRFEHTTWLSSHSY